jgi:hypothetical protein
MFMGTEDPVAESLESDFSMLGYSLEEPSSPEEPPSPATVKRKQFSKLRRHLGASLPPELVYGDEGVLATSPCKAPVLENVPEDEQDYVYLGMDGEEDSSEESESEESGESGHGELEWESQLPLDSMNKRPGDQHCGRWMREEGGRRWLISNYEEVIQALRDL